MMKSKLAMPLLPMSAQTSAPARNGNLFNCSYSSQSLPSGFDYLISRNNIVEREDQFTQNCPGIAAVSFLPSFYNNGDTSCYEVVHPAEATIFPATITNRNTF